MRRIIAAVALSFMLASPVWAGFDEGLAAYNRGDYATALREFRPLAEQGNAIAQYELGAMYDSGLSLPQDYTRAVKWYRKAAEQDLTIAQESLGHMYVRGHGVPQNFVKAHMWFNLAASQGEIYVPKFRDIIAKRMTPDDISEAQKLASEWAAKHRKK